MSNFELLCVLYFQNTVDLVSCMLSRQLHGWQAIQFMNQFSSLSTLLVWKITQRHWYELYKKFCIILIIFVLVSVSISIHMHNFNNLKSNTFVTSADVGIPIASPCRRPENAHFTSGDLFGFIEHAVGTDYYDLHCVTFGTCPPHTKQKHVMSHWMQHWYHDDATTTEPWLKV